MNERFTNWVTRSVQGNMKPDIYRMARKSEGFVFLIRTE